MTQNRLAAAVAFVLAIATCWVYAPTLENGFVWDDHANLGGARASWDQGLAGVAWAFREPFFGHYQPLTWLSYQLDVLLSGGGPRGMHATQLLLHLLAAAAVALLARALARTPALRGISALSSHFFPLAAAALFALAPVRVESVAWITERRDLLGAIFAMLAVALHLRASPEDDSPSRFRLAIAGLAALSALSRAQMSLPFVLLALDLWPLRRLAGAELEGKPSKGFKPTPGGEIDLLDSGEEKGSPRGEAPRFIGSPPSPRPRGEGGRGERSEIQPPRQIFGAARWRSFGRLVAEKAVLFAVSAASAVAAMWAQTSGGALTALAEHGPLDRVVQAFYGLAFYPVAAFLPQALGRPLLPLYERPSPFAPFAAEYLLPAVAAAVALLLAAVFRRRAPALAVAVASYLLLVLPVLGIAQSGIQLVADRYAYLATVPLLLLAAGLFARGLAAAGGAAPVLALLLAALLATDAVAARKQTRVWHDDLTLWTHVTGHSASGLADNNLGQLFGGRGESAKALFHLTRSLERMPRYSRPWDGLAALLEAPWPPGAPDPRWVAATLSRALAWQPGVPAARFATALAHLRSGDDAAAERELRRLLAIDQAHDGARLALARLAARRAAAPPESAGQRLELGADLGGGIQR